MRWRLLTASFLILFLAVPAESASVKLAWDPARSRDIVGYRIHYGTEPGKYTQKIQVEGRLTAKAVIENLEEGKTYFFAISSYDAKGRESLYSNEITNDPKRNQRPPHAGKSRDRTRPEKTSNPQAPQNEKNGPAEGQAPAHEKISQSRKPTKTSEGKILPSRRSNRLEGPAAPESQSPTH